MHIQLLHGCQGLWLRAIQYAVEFALPDRIQHQPVLLAKLMLLLCVAGLPLARLGGVGFGPLANAASADEYLGLEQQFSLARLALHVVDGVAMLHVGIEAKNNKEL